MDDSQRPKHQQAAGREPPKPGSTKFLVYITDGDGKNSKRTVLGDSEQQIREKLSKRGFTVHKIGRVGLSEPSAQSAEPAPPTASAGPSWRLTVRLAV